MFIDFKELQALGRYPFDAVTTATTTTANGLQAIVSETTGYSKTSLEKSRALATKLIGATRLDEVIQLQTDFARKACEDFIAQATKVANLYSDLAAEASKASLTVFKVPASSPAQPTTTVSAAQPQVTASPAPAKAPAAAKQA